MPLYPELVKPVAALTPEDALVGGMLEGRLPTNSVVDPVSAALNRETSRQNFSLGCPSVATPREVRLAWLKSSVQRGIAFLESQPNYHTIRQASEILQGILNEQPSKEVQSKAHYNHLKRQAKEVLANLTANLNPETKFHENDTNSEEFDAIVERLDDRWKRWWRGNRYPILKLREVLQHAMIGVGYLGPIWSNELFGLDAPDVDLDVYGMEDVFLDQITDDWDEQKAYSVTLYKRVPTIRMRQHWAEQAMWIFPSTIGIDDVGTKGRGTEANHNRPVNQNAIMGLLTGTDGIGSPKNSSSVRGIRTKNSTNGALYTDVYFTYINDATLNATGRLLTAKDITETDEIHLPDLRRNYIIPPVGVEVSITKSAESEPRKYEPFQCRLYPSRRLIIWTPDHILYDGPSFYHHGQVPIVKFQLDPNVWSYGGGNIVEDNRSLSATINVMLRGWVDALNVRLDPPMEVNEKELNATTFVNFSLRKPKQWIKRKGASIAKRAIEPILDYQTWEVGDQILPFIEFALNRMNHAFGTEDFSNLAKLQQIPDSATIEKLMNASSPVMSDYASLLERSMTRLGYHLMWMWMQFDTTAIKLQTESLESLMFSEFDNAMGDMVPGKLALATELENSSFFYRLRNFMKKLGFKITPQSIFNVTDWKRKMVLYQFYREGKFPIDSATIAEAFGIENFGKIPGSSIYDRWINEQKARIPFEAALAGKAMQTQMVASGVGQVQAQVAASSMVQQIQQGMQTGEVSPELAMMVMQALLMQGSERGGVDVSNVQPQLNSPGVGRPPTAQTSPQFEMKANGDGTRRPIVKES